MSHRFLIIAAIAVGATTGASALARVTSDDAISNKSAAAGSGWRVAQSKNEAGVEKDKMKDTAAGIQKDKMKDTGIQKDKMKDTGIEKDKKK